jgi:hypothetical protein
LPEDGAYYTCSMFVHSDWRQRPEESALVAHWTEYPQKIAVQSPTWFAVYDERDPIYTGIFQAEHCPTLPAIMIQHADGRVVYKDSGDHLMANEGGVARWRLSHRPVLLPWNREVSDCDCNRHHKKTPDAKPAPNIHADVVVNVPDRVLPRHEAQKEDGGGFFAILAVLCSLAGVGAGAFMFYKAVHESP